MNIIIKTEAVKIEAELNESETAKRIWDALPFAKEVATWGEEIYFEIPVTASLESGVEEVQAGDIAYWPQGKCFCIFFGMTPVSSEGKIKPASAVTVIGKVIGEAKEFLKVKDGDWIAIEKV